MSPLPRVPVVLAMACMLLALSLTAALAASTGSVTLLWTAPGDDGLVGRASAYDIRYSLSPITEANFSAATRVTGTPVPKAVGSAESFTVTNLTAGMGYYFALKTGDEVPNWSAISNSLYDPVVTSGTRAEALTASLSSPWPNPARESASWSYTLPKPGRIDIEVFDVAGRHVRNVVSGITPAGQGDVVWDLRDDTGRKVAAGIYMARASLGTQSSVKRVVVSH